MPPPVEQSDAPAATTGAPLTTNNQRSGNDMPATIQPSPRPAGILTSRKQRGTAHCWQEKEALRKIRESFDVEKTVASAIGVYVALTEIASDKQCEKFTTTHGYISMKSGLSPRTVQDRLNRLSEIGLVQIQTPALKAPSVYTLPLVRQPLPNEAQPLPNARQRGNFRPLLTLEESNEESNEESKNRQRSRFQTRRVDPATI